MFQFRHWHWKWSVMRRKQWLAELKRATQKISLKLQAIPNTRMALNGGVFIILSANSGMRNLSSKWDCVRWTKTSMRYWFRILIKFCELKFQFLLDPWYSACVQDCQSPSHENMLQRKTVGSIDYVITEIDAYFKLFGESGVGLWRKLKFLKTNFFFFFF